MTCEHDLQTETEWLETIRKTIGASMVPAVLGLDAYCSPLEAYLRYRGELPWPDQNQAMRLGHALEAVVDDEYREQTGRQTEDLGRFTIQTSDDAPWLHATLDRRIMPCDGHDMPGVLECKAAGLNTGRTWQREGPPWAVQAQLQTQLLVTGCTWGSVAAVIGGTSFEYWDFEADPEVHAAILDDTAAFWARVEAGNPPLARASDLVHIKRIFAGTPGESIELPQAAIALTDQLNAAKDTIRNAEKSKKEAEAKLRVLLGNAMAGEIPGVGTWIRRLTEIPESTKPRKAYTRDTLTFKESEHARD